MYEVTNSFSVCFNIMKMKYSEFDATFDELNFIKPTDTVNVFINLETVFNHLSTIRDLDKKLVSETEYKTIISADILNLAAHYKRFFRQNRLKTRVFLYMTDFNSNHFKEEEYNEDYRSYYLNKFNSNPRISSLTDALRTIILPSTKQIAEFIPDVHIIESLNVDSSVVPLVIAKEYPDDKNVVITGDIYDTQYSFSNNFCVHYLRKSPLHSSTSWTLQGYLKEIFKREPDNKTEVATFCNVSFYLAMLSCIGEKYRSIDPIRRIGTITSVKLLYKALMDHALTPNTDSIETIKEVFPEDMREELVNNFYQYSIKWKEQVMSEAERFQITSQIVNRFDNNSLLRLNSTKFYHHNLMLEELTM